MSTYKEIHCSAKTHLDTSMWLVALGRFLTEFHSLVILHVAEKIQEIKEKVHIRAKINSEHCVQS